ncbi:dihydroorotase [Parvibacter caecicola]|uniref:Dihydroorotase n=1 Tax=Parvibacter caecicola TaxID=747645 RepID=A0A4T9T9Q9_9ACTN|nr:dihydroorotase [Parvibacter caecicola]TJW12082.1 dihydroorotase [Parvibacter caecicola]
MALMLKNARVIDPQVGLDEVRDILVRDGRIVEVGHNLTMEKGVERDLSGKVLVPGLVDIHVHLREPGGEQKEDIASGTRAAAHGGFTAVCAMPNTAPVIDNAMGVEYVKAVAAAKGKARVYVAGACSQGLKGETLSEMGDMVAHGASAFTDDGKGIQDAGMMRRVMDYASQFNRVVMVHAQDNGLVGDGQVNEGVASTRLGMLGWPAEGEEIEIARDIALCRLTGCPLHIQHVTTARGLDLVRAAKAEGLPVTCEVTPHHMFLTEDAITDEYQTCFKVNPPLRTAEDAAALVAGVADGTVDCIVTDHAPHTDWEKDREFELAPFGMTGLETSLGLVLTHLVNEGVIDFNRMVELMAVNPRQLMRDEPVKIEAGCVADFTVIDPEASWTVEAHDFYSRANNSGFIGARLKGRATDTYVGGYATMEDGVVVE